MSPCAFRFAGVCAVAALTLAAAPAVAAVNIIPAHSVSVAVAGVFGVLRAGSPWVPGSTLPDVFAPIDGVFEPENQQWNNSSFWWDEDPSVNPAGPVSWTVFLDDVYTLNRFVAQADDNDTYLLEWWDGGAWQTAWNIPGVFTFGLTTRDSGLIAPVTTDRLRFTATGGDNYYALSELQAFAVPEPGTWALMIAGFGLAGAALRRRSALTAS
jgi:hypothetical protein